MKTQLKIEMQMNRILLFCSLMLQFTLYSQEKETIVLKKNTSNLYRGVLAETKSWYLLVDSEFNYYLANINKPNEEVLDWFTRFKDSQNIYKANPQQTKSASQIGGNKLLTLHFTKENEPGDILNFYIEKPYSDSIILISMDDNTIFKFQIEEY